MKASAAFTMGSWFYISDPDNPKLQDAWHAQFQIDSNWVHMRIPFEEFVIGKTWRQQAAKRWGLDTGKEIMDLSHVESVGFGLKNHTNDEHAQIGKIWVDNVRFYTEE